MKHTVFTLFVLTGISFSAMGAQNQVKVAVNGMVCAFCSQGLTKKFGAEPGVSKVNVDLNKKIVELDLKAGATISDEKIKEVISDAGFNVEKIER